MIQVAIPFSKTSRPTLLAPGVRLTEHGSPIRPALFYCAGGPCLAG
jgi:hypothetical protein